MPEVKTEAPRLTEERDIHETIVDAIRRCSSPSSGEILRLFQLIKDTKILAGHDTIISEIDKFFDFPGANKWARDIRLMRECLLAKKQAASEKAAPAAGEKKCLEPGTNLYELELKTKALVSVLTHPESDSKRWNASIREQVEIVHKITGKALGK